MKEEYLKGTKLIRKIVIEIKIQPKGELTRHSWRDSELEDDSNSLRVLSSSRMSETVLCNYI